MTMPSGPADTAPVAAVPAGRVDVSIHVVEQPDAQVHGQVRAFLAAAPAGSIAFAEHDPGWLDVLAAGLRHRPYAVIARREGETAGEGIVGYLPLALTTSRIFGRFLVSLPYLDRAGIVAADSTVAAALIDAAVRLAAAVDADYLELRQERVHVHPALTAQRSDKARLVLGLPATADNLWQQVGSKVRNQVRKGERNALTVHWGGAELVDEFYTVFAATMRDLGTPVFSRRLFDQLLERFATAAELAVVRHRGRPLAAALLIHTRGGGLTPQTHVPSAASLRRARSMNANMWMYYQLLVRAIERGSHLFDFGRSTVDSPTYRFKQQWGAHAQPTVWQYHVRRGTIDAARPHDPRFALARALWRRLPVAVTRWLGPPLARGLP